MTRREATTAATTLCATLGAGFTPSIYATASDWLWAVERRGPRGSRLTVYPPYHLTSAKFRAYLYHEGQVYSASAATAAGAIRKVRRGATRVRDRLNEALALTEPTPRRN